MFSFLFVNNIPAGKAKRILARQRRRDCIRTDKIGPDLPRLKTVRVSGRSSSRGRLYLQFPW